MPSRECAVDFGRISRRLLFRRSCHIIFTFHIFMTECELVPPKDREKNHAQARRLESSASQCPSSPLSCSCWCESRLPSVFLAVVCVLASLRKNEDQVARVLVSLHHRATHVPRDPDTLEDRTKGAPRAVDAGVCATHAPHRLVSGATRLISFSPFKARPPSLRASPHRSVARAAPFADAPRLPEPPSRHTPWLTKARFPPSCAITAPAWSRCVPDHPRAPCERHRRSSGVPSAARF